ncbi:aldehyde dehydrogenase [Gonapodya prolifera JEL478]|uniref:Succinate-semialdehyde dehydrogenase, mitochondrial n=1 Tax=Gonapodya prolifera (strain JEL478) TaxID=1344416 RepID=A0A139A4Q8_GONPJ|nr:aldehyde dehydrogenase [Gonapodya prolifera JEL478]|eukprot:KXS11760.1 aldehyde dehydrogenase [Gonapodya prolifera JEL478]
MNGHDLHPADASEFELDGCFLDKADATQPKPPYRPLEKYLINGILREWNGPVSDVFSPIRYRGSSEKIKLGTYPLLSGKDALEILDSAHKAYNYGHGEWPSMTTAQRIDVVSKFVNKLKEKRDEIIELIMWEICKTQKDSQKEVDRTIEYVEKTVEALKSLENKDNAFIEDGGTVAQIRRRALGVVLCSGPFNYPFNETYATLIPALIMGNTVVMKLPRVGVLCHVPTFEIFRDVFPKGVVNVLPGTGRETLPPIMASGKIDCFAFIGSTNAADALVKAHPAPHKLRMCLGLEAKNPAIILPDADLDVAVSECVLGSLSYNGQRCTAIKVIFVHESIAKPFLDKFATSVDSMKLGVPWMKDVKITPLPEENKPNYIHQLMDDAIAKGAKIVNPKGGKFDRTLITPPILFPCNEHMRVMQEEQFGPLVPVASFSSISEVEEYFHKSKYGQQAAIFGKDPKELSRLIDSLTYQVARVNINTQCQRGPDVFPFTGRKDSSIGTLSINDALRVFSIRVMVATAETLKVNTEIVTKIVRNNDSTFLRLEHIF